MRRTFFLLLLLAVSALTACAQVEMEVWSYVYAEPSTGNVWTEGYTYVYNLNPFIGEYGTDYYANVQSYLSPTYSYGASTTNNCGMGCAYDWFGDQVPYLGTTLTLYSYHQGQGYDVSLGSFYMWQTSQSSYSIPSSVPLVFTGIDARNPDNVLWSVSTNGLPAPWQINFNMPGVYQFVSGSYATTNQTQYEDGQSLAYLTGQNYGITFGGQQCIVSVSTGGSRQGSTASLVSVGGGDQNGIFYVPAVINAYQQGSFYTTDIGYFNYTGGSGCSNVYPGSSTTRLWNVSDTIDTTNNTNTNVDADIDVFAAVAAFPTQWQGVAMPPTTLASFPVPQGPRFKTVRLPYDTPGIEVWIPSAYCTGLCAVQESQVCPSTLLIGLAAANTAANLGCWFVSLP